MARQPVYLLIFLMALSETWTPDPGRLQFMPVLSGTASYW
jgi:hypothetical protein